MEETNLDPNDKTLKLEAIFENGQQLNDYNEYKASNNNSLTLDESYDVQEQKSTTENKGLAKEECKESLSPVTELKIARYWYLSFFARAFDTTDTVEDRRVSGWFMDNLLGAL